MAMLASEIFGLETVLLGFARVGVVVQEEGDDVGVPVGSREVQRGGA